MPRSCVLYYITDRTVLARDEPTRRKRLLDKVAEAARTGVDCIQLREKDLSARELESLAREAVALINELRAENRELSTALLINSRTDVALATGADGVHLRSDDISPQQARMIWSKSHVGTAPGSPARPNLAPWGRGVPGRPAVRGASATDVATSASPRSPLTGVSCHSPEEVGQAAQAGASFAVFAPVFEKKDSPGTTPAGLALLAQASRASIPVLALGGINLENAHACLEAGAAGIAAIRLFQENDIASVARRLRG
jgi:thiamine-phosphate pyrophosphorylase